MAKVSVYIDGFNLYHAIDESGRHELKWISHRVLARVFPAEGRRARKSSVLYCCADLGTLKAEATQELHSGPGGLQRGSRRVGRPPANRENGANRPTRRTAPGAPAHAQARRNAPVHSRPHRRSDRLRYPRSLADDKSGDTLAGLLAADGHELADRAIERDDIDAIRARVQGWIADPTIDVVITTGGTGFTGRDVTPGGA